MSGEDQGKGSISNQLFLLFQPGSSKASAPLSAWLHLWEITLRLLSQCNTNTHLKWKQATHNQTFARTHIFHICPHRSHTDNWRQDVKPAVNLAVNLSNTGNSCNVSLYCFDETDGICSKSPYKGPNWTSYSLQLNICWVSCPSGGFGLKQNGPRETPPFPQTYTQWQKTIYRHACTHTSYISVKHECTREYRFHTSSLFLLPIGSPSQSDMATDSEEDWNGVFSCQLIYST